MEGCEENGFEGVAVDTRCMLEFRIALNLDIHSQDAESKSCFYRDKYILIV